MTDKPEEWYIVPDGDYGYDIITDSRIIARDLTKQDAERLVQLNKIHSEVHQITKEDEND